MGYPPRTGGAHQPIKKKKEGEKIIPQNIGKASIEKENPIRFDQSPNTMPNRIEQIKKETGDSTGRPSQRVKKGCGRKTGTGAERRYTVGVKYRVPSEIVPGSMKYIDHRYLLEEIGYLISRVMTYGRCRTGSPVEPPAASK